MSNQHVVRIDDDAKAVVQAFAVKHECSHSVATSRLVMYAAKRLAALEKDYAKRKAQPAESAPESFVQFAGQAE